jgi:hypothetical protein
LYLLPFYEGIADMYRAFVAIVLGLLLTVSVGCQTKELETDSNLKFQTDEAARKKAMETTMEKMGANMRPEMKAQMEKMQSQGVGAKGAEGSGTTTTKP